ncbi:hypothetical protein BJY04DRAFT_215780 [Aspergillus karnatakaensis]|uniref:uncharacterized protein n=1 Tax=Aspergillus karnatakaensis TaxID=1810916 RepID=UPI003CCE4C36
MRVLLLFGYVQLVSFLPPWATASPIETAPVVSEPDISSLNYTSRTPPNYLVKRSELDLSHCSDPRRAGALSMGYADAKLLAAAADRNLAALVAFLDRNPRPTRAQARRWNRRLIETYEAIYGRVVSPHNWDMAIEALKTLSLRASTLNLALRTDIWPKIEILCDDDWLLELPGLDPDELWDNRPAHRGGQQALDLAGDGKCSGNRYFAFTTSYKDIGLDLALYCPQWFNNWGTNRIQDLAASPSIPRTWHIENVERFYIPLTVLHELTHSHNILGRSYTDSFAYFAVGGQFRQSSITTWY